MSYYDDWLKDPKPTIFSYNTNNNYKSASSYLHFIPDLNGLSGILFYLHEEADYGYYYVGAKVIIYHEKKLLYIQSIIFHFESKFREIDINGGIRSYKKNKLESHDKVFKNMTNIFFGNDWHFHFGFTPFYKKNIYKHYLKIVKKSFENVLPNDICGLITQKSASQWNDIKDITIPDCMYISEKVNQYVGVKTIYGQKYDLDKVVITNF
jgi:hypothetical protein